MVVVHFIVLLALVAPALAVYGDLRINGDGDSGRLEFKRSDGSWGTVCDDGFDNDAGDVACRQLGYKRLGSVNKYDYSNNVNPANLRVAICYTQCNGHEDKLTHCLLSHCGAFYYCSHYEDIAIACTDDLPVGAVVGIVFGVLFFIGCVCCCIAILLCCCIPSCGCYYKGHVQHTRIATTSYNRANDTATIVEPPPPYSATDTYPPPTDTSPTTQLPATITQIPVVPDSPPAPYPTDFLPDNLLTANGNAVPDYPVKQGNFTE